jgi:type II secretory pathway predicted ATPase ExeA
VSFNLLKKFGLLKWPFVTHPLPDVFIDVAHVEHLVELILNCGIVAITADVGFGKTTTLLKLAKLVEEQVEDVKPVIVRGPRLTVEDVLYALVQECGVKSKAQTRQQLIVDIAKGGKHGKPLLMIDDFDYAPSEVQELVKLLHDHGVNIVLTYRDSNTLDRSVKSRIVYEVKLPKLDVQHVKQLLLDRWL